jgi:thiol-disulfide isomerase/thioredoxin
MLLTAALVVTGLDLSVETAIAGVLPAGWTGALVAVEQQPLVKQELGMPVTNPPGAVRTSGSTGEAGAPGSSGLPAAISSSLPTGPALDDLGPAPEFAGITAWINANPLTIASLRGRVVLVEFWTFGCVNCQHVEPYVKAWYERYAASGFVVIGVHTPELSFERDLGNVRNAVASAGLSYPVAFDPTYATWNAYHNGYWPAFYFIDRAGRIRHTHVGEGDYAGSEQVIRQLLGPPAG